MSLFQNLATGVLAGASALAGQTLVQSQSDKIHRIGGIGGAAMIGSWLAGKLQDPDGRMSSLPVTGVTALGAAAAVSFTEKEKGYFMQGAYACAAGVAANLFAEKFVLKDAIGS